MIHLDFGSGDDFRNAGKLKKVKTSLVRWFRRHFPGPDSYHLVLEFKHRSSRPHFHVCITVPPDEETKRLLHRFWSPRSGGGSIEWETKRDDVPDAIARYAAKSRQKTNPPWFDRHPFQPYSHNFRKKDRPRVTVRREEANRCGLTKHRLVHDGVLKLPPDLREKVSPLSGGKTCEEMALLSGSPSMSDIGDTPATYSYPSTSYLMTRSCYTCWHRRGRYISRMGTQVTCDQCGEAWRPASVGVV